jgi:hypothetical protein
MVLSVLKAAPFLTGSLRTAKKFLRRTRRGDGRGHPPAIWCLRLTCLLVLIRKRILSAVLRANNASG